MSRVIGIDLGTTNSCVAVIDGGDVVVIPNAEGSRTTPSVVGFSDDERFVGQVAKRQALTNPHNTVYAAKRLIGRRFEDDEVQEAIKTSAYPIVRAKNGDAWVEAGGQQRPPAEISAIVLQTIREIAEEYLGESIADAVITVPAYFNDSQRQATRDAGRIAGLNVLRIINEPTAASLAYGLGSDGGSETIAVYDLGGGTFDISILQLGDGLYEVLSTNGDTFLGGEDFDNRIIDQIADEFVRDHGSDPRDDAMALQRLKEAAERAKHELSSMETTEINLPFLTVSGRDPVHLIRKVTRAELEDWCGDLVERTLGPCEAALQDAGLGVNDITQVILVGGQTRMPLVQKRVTEFFGRTPSQGVNPDEVVAVGAAVQGAVLLGEIEEVVLLDVTPLSLGIETAGGTFTPLIERNTPIPVQASDVFTNTVDGQNVVSVHVLQGERPMAVDNHSLARFELYDIPPGPRGSAQIEVTFNIDVNGMVSVSATDLVSRKSQSIRVIGSGGLSEDEIESMIADAAAQREADQLRVEKAELGTRVSGLIYTTEKSVAEYGAYLEPDEIQAIQDVLDHAHAILEQPEAVPVDDFHAALHNLEQSAQRVAEAMYQAMMQDES